MPVSPIGNMNFINQNMAYPATQTSNELAKEGFASIANMNEFIDKEKTIDKLEKVNETKEINQEVKERSQEEKEKKKKKFKDNQDEEEDDSEEYEENQSKEEQQKNIHHLDMSI
ncbi:hypothetical protein JG676_06740 [Campylobacter sp. 2018MI35]|uniref:hypothetical protein n=1 Tax=Campylobacter sp. 2018MI34 TaxID=2800582 RepID=UPI001904862E|nr:hypothetical protein [Campylobacter sp. 2018MI34]MBK1992289.1 hypothetical protein [Campylobacter sp. 2018MI34]